MVISLRRSNVSGSPHIYVINTYAKIRSRNQTATLSLRTYNVKWLAGQEPSSAPQFFFIRFSMRFGRFSER